MPSVSISQQQTLPSAKHLFGFEKHLAEGNDI